VHAEANAIISAARRDMIGSTLYLAGRDAKTNELLGDTTPCTMCRRLIINAGIVKIVCRTGAEKYTVVNTRDWVYNDDSVTEMPVNAKASG
jgi:dCMP deaminase